MITKQNEKAVCFDGRKCSFPEAEKSLDLNESSLSRLPSRGRGPVEPQRPVSTIRPSKVRKEMINGKCPNQCGAQIYIYIDNIMFYLSLRAAALGLVSIG